MDNNPKLLLRINRNNLLDESYYGSYFVYENNVKIFSFGLDEKDIVFIRSLAKPLQAAISCDSNIINDYKITSEMLAIFQGSHSGSSIHIDLLNKILKKYSIKKSSLMLSADEPLDKKNYTGRKDKLYNNCSGKHIFMVLNSMYLGFDTENYIDPEHQIQKLILKKQNELSGYKSNILTFDGCGTPLWGLPVKNLIKAYFNFFNDKKYSPLINSVINNPYLFGGNNRFDTEIIQISKGNLYSKVGAGGFVLVYNFKLNSMLVVKLTQNNNPIRRLITLHILNKLNWLKTDIDDNIYNQLGKKVAKYCYEIDI